MATDVKATYNTTDVNGTRVDKVVNERAFRAICGVNHLTPATEAEMGNCLRPNGTIIPAPTREQTIEENSPDYKSPTELVLAEDIEKEDDRPYWERGPTRADLRQIETE